MPRKNIHELLAGARRRLDRLSPEEGYMARLKELGLSRATDVVDGVVGWKAAGLPIGPATAS